jgi:hypothetical protein
MIIITSLKKGKPGIELYGRKGVGFSNHDPAKGDILFTANLVMDKFFEEKAVFKDRKELKEEVLIPALTKAGSKNPKAMSNMYFGWWKKEGRLIEV